MVEGTSDRTPAAPDPLGLTLGTARLAGIQGDGVMRVRRDLNGEVIEILGTWRMPSAEAVPDVLRRAQDDATPVAYEGPLADSAEPNRERITVKVALHGIHSYTRLPVGKPHGAEDGTDRGTPLTLIHLQPLDLPYPATVAAKEQSKEPTSGTGRRSRQTVPEVGSVEEDGVPPFVATLDGVPGGSWDVSGNGEFVWYSTPAESDMAFLDLFARTEAMRESGPVVLETRHPAAPTEVPTADPNGAPRNASKTRARTVSSHRVEVEQVGRSRDANYIVARGTER